MYYPRAGDALRTAPAHHRPRAHTATIASRATTRCRRSGTASRASGSLPNRCPSSCGPADRMAPATTMKPAMGRVHGPPGERAARPRLDRPYSSGDRASGTAGRGGRERSQNGTPVAVRVPDPAVRRYLPLVRHRAVPLRDDDRRRGSSGWARTRTSTSARKFEETRLRSQKLGVPRHARGRHRARLQQHAPRDPGQRAARSRTCMPRDGSGRRRISSRSARRASARRISSGASCLSAGHRRRATR